MKSLISINSKFIDVPASKIIEKLVNSKYTKGIEVFSSPDDVAMLSYMDELVEGCKENNLLFQIHGDSSLDIEIQKQYLDKIAKYSDYLGYTINVVLHSVLRDNTDESLHDSQEYFGELLEYIDHNKIRLSIENLNDADGLIRLDKDEMIPILYNDSRLYMTYDIGHEIADYGKITNIDEELVKRISNVHLHEATCIYDIGYDHKPINDEGDFFQQVLKGILFLKQINYEGPVVFEYDLYLCNGETNEAKVDDYIHSIDDTSEHMI